MTSEIENSQIDSLPVLTPVYMNDAEKIVERLGRQFGDKVLESAVGDAPPNSEAYILWHAVSPRLVTTRANDWRPQPVPEREKIDIGSLMIAFESCIAEVDATLLKLERQDPANAHLFRMAMREVARYFESQAALAEYYGVGASGFSKWLKGDVAPPVARRSRLFSDARALLKATSSALREDSQFFTKIFECAGEDRSSFEEAYVNVSATVTDGRVEDIRERLLLRKSASHPRASTTTPTAV